MNRMNFAGCSGVVIDWCKAHGTWLDHTELPQIIAFIRDGGLRTARDREKEMLKGESRRLRMKELRLAAKEGQLPRDTSTLSWNNDSDSLLDLLSSVWQSLKD
jgi:Zn-finger nucleic acid-binding protein